MDGPKNGLKKEEGETQTVSLVGGGVDVPCGRKDQSPKKTDSSGEPGRKNKELVRGRGANQFNVCEDQGVTKPAAIQKMCAEG